MSTIAHQTSTQVIRYVANPAFTLAILVFADDSRLLFEHSSREQRWAKASAEQSMADHCCQALHQFRLNAKHLQLFFTDDSDLEFVTPGAPTMPD
ncbi:MAG: hypothetical protein R3C14_29690 [Caldilineaceae bacterium]